MMKTDCRKNEGGAPDQFPDKSSINVFNKRTEETLTPLIQWGESASARL